MAGKARLSKARLSKALGSLKPGGSKRKSEPPTRDMSWATDGIGPGSKAWAKAEEEEEEDGGNSRSNSFDRKSRSKQRSESFDRKGKGRLRNGATPTGAAALAVFLLGPQTPPRQVVTRG